jgi:hypothetical protein
LFRIGGVLKLFNKLINSVIQIQTEWLKINSGVEIYNKSNCILPYYNNGLRWEKIVLVSLSEGTMGGRRGKDVKEWKKWNNPPMCVHNAL